MVESYHFLACFSFDYRCFMVLFATMAWDKSGYCSSIRESDDNNNYQLKKLTLSTCVVAMSVLKRIECVRRMKNVESLFILHSSLKTLI